MKILDAAEVTKKRQVGFVVVYPGFPCKDSLDFSQCKNLASGVIP
jgi:hypothetical protein